MPLDSGTIPVLEVGTIEALRQHLGGTHASYDYAMHCPRATPSVGVVGLSLLASIGGIFSCLFLVGACSGLYSLYKINGQDVFECHVCLGRFNMQSRDCTNIKSSILAIRQHAASQGHQNLQVARIMHANAIKTIVDRLPRPVPDAITIHEGSNHQTYAEYTQLYELINETNTLILGWKRKRNNKSGIAYVPEAVEVATPSKFLRLSDSGREELERLEDATSSGATAQLDFGAMTSST
ncbi:TPA: hypothetical protein ACH3X1_015647 [Trebouxia sp. C0004]